MKYRHISGTGRVKTDVPDSLVYLDKSSFKTGAADLNTVYWSQNLNLRWEYHKAAIDMMKSAGTRKPVLEIGTCCMPLVRGSVSMDLGESYFPDRGWPPGYPDTIHDINNPPWPFPDIAFDTLVALQVFEHVESPEVMKEALRVADKVILSLPFEWTHSRHPGHTGLTMKGIVGRYGKPDHYMFTGKNNTRRIIALWNYKG